MLGEQELEFSHETDGTPVEIEDEDEDEPEPIRTPSLEEARAGFMLLDL
jgi:hypothetical protein